jgi:hypothetical protein
LCAWIVWSCTTNDTTEAADSATSSNGTIVNTNRHGDSDTYPAHTDGDTTSSDSDAADSDTADADTADADTPGDSDAADSSTVDKDTFFDTETAESTDSERSTGDSDLFVKLYAIEITPTELEMTQYLATRSFHATCIFSDDTTVDCTDDVRWHSSNQCTMCPGTLSFERCRFILPWGVSRNSGPSRANPLEFLARSEDGAYLE